MGSVRCDITTVTKDGFTIEAKSKEGKIYQKRTSFTIQERNPIYYQENIMRDKTVLVRILVNYGDLITAVRGYGAVELTDLGSGLPGKKHLLREIDNDPTNDVVKKSVKVTKETVIATKPQPRGSRTVWDG